MGVCNCSMFCCTLLFVHFSIAIILMGKRELIALLNLSSWCLVMVERLFLTVPRGCLQFVIVVFPDHTHLLFFKYTIPCMPCVLKDIMRRSDIKIKKVAIFIKIYWANPKDADQVEAVRHILKKNNEHTNTYTKTHKF